MPEYGLRERVLSAIGPPDGLWLWKGSALYGPAIMHAFPEAKIVCPVRDYESTVASALLFRLPHLLTEEQVRKAVTDHLDYIEQIIREGLAVPVYTDSLIQGNYHSIEKALVHCNITPNREIIDSIVDPSLWHHKRSQ